MFSKRIRRLARPTVDLALRSWGWWISRLGVGELPIVIAATGRGGSTWLAELLECPPGLPLLWEPLHLGTNPSCRNYGFDWQQYIPIGANEPRKRAFFESLFTGTGMNVEWITSTHFDLRQYLRFRRFLVKFVNANLLLPWLVREFQLRTLLLIRHPCSVVASQLRHSAWQYLTKDILTFSPALATNYPHFARCFAQLNELEELLAWEWAQQIYVPLASPLPHQWRLVAYESLVTDGPAELQRIFDYLDMPVPDAAEAHLRTPSSTTTHESSLRLGDRRLDRWREQLTPQQIDNIYKVVHAMGVHFYDGPDLPDFDMIARLPLQAPPN
jgi:hypothetical protein